MEGDIAARRPGGERVAVGEVAANRLGAERGDGGRRAFGSRQPPDPVPSATSRSISLPPMNPEPPVTNADSNPEGVIGASLRKK